ncbi:MAG: glycoside hydrolase family 127 protein [Streptosporangiaceae bacterium]
MTISGGFWERRQRTNRLVSLPLGRDRLEGAGNLENFREVARGARHTPARGLPVFDSDVYKWLEAVGWELGRRPDVESAEKLRGLSGDVISMIQSAQAPDGYVGSWYRTAGSRFSDLLYGLELYNAGHLFQAGVALARGADDDRLLGVSARFADYIGTMFGPGRRQGIPEHPGIEMALVGLYRATGEARYLELGEFFLDQRGHAQLTGGPFGPRYRQDDIPFRDSHVARGHAVMASYLACGALDVFAETGDRALLDAAVAQWEDMVARRMYLTGGVGSRHKDEAFGDPFELPPDRAYCETCAAIGVIMWSWRLLLITGEPRYADLIERVLFNAFAVGVSLDGRSYFYVNLLQVRAGHQDPEDGRGRAARSGWYEIACCPPNVMRTLSSLENYFATTTPDGIQIWQYAPSQLDVTLGGQPTGLTIQTGYPDTGQVIVRVDHAGAAPFEIALRVPAWCQDAHGHTTIGSRPRENGHPQPGAGEHLEPGTLWRVRRRWQPGDQITLNLAMPPRLTIADPRIDAVRGCAAVERGPLVYCLEETDTGSAGQLESLRLGDEEDLTPAGIQIAGEPVTVLRGQGHAQPAPDSGLFPYHPAATAQEPATPADLQLIPYYAWGNRHPGQTMRTWIPR